MMPNGSAEAARAASVQAFPTFEQGGVMQMLVRFADSADRVTPWGLAPQVRDKELREFWKSEPWLASAINAVASRDASFRYTVTGGKQTAKAVSRMLDRADFGNGWATYMQKLDIDRLTTDNGCFLEFQRVNNDDPTSPVIGLGHLDSNCCVRTGDPNYPVFYMDKLGRWHKLRPWNVSAISDMPDPDQNYNGIGLCAVSRVLAVAQYARNIQIYRDEKTSGRFTKAIHFVAGIQTQQITTAMGNSQDKADEKGQRRFIMPTIIGGISLDKGVSVATINLAEMPEDYNAETEQKYYIALLALALGCDYQDLAPLPGGNLGTSTQSQVLAEKSRGKGPALYQRQITYALTYQQAIPANCEFTFDEDDDAEGESKANQAKVRAETRQTMLASGEINKTVARQKAVEAGDLTQEQMDLLEAADAEAEKQAVAQAQQQAEQTPEEGGTDTSVQDGDGQPGAGPNEVSQLSKARRKNVMTTADWEALQAPLQTAVAGALADLETDVLAIVGGLKNRTEKAKPSSIEDQEFWKTAGAKWKAATGPAVRATIRNGLGRPVAGIPADIDLVNQRVLDVSRTYSDRWWEQLEKTTRDGLRSAVTTWQSNGLGDKGLPDLIDSISPLFGADRAERIAATEATRLFALGRMEAMQDNPLVMQWDWTTGEDEKVCEICGEYAANGPYTVGEGPEFPAHPNCRCEPVEVIP